MNKTLAFIDDEPDILTVTTFRLRRIGYRILTAEDGARGLEMVRREKPDLVFLDLLMPEMDGYEVCRRLKADEATRHIPVVLFTAVEEERVPGARRETGADGVLLKPFTPDKLLAAVEQFLPPEKPTKKKRGEKK